MDTLQSTLDLNSTGQSRVSFYENASNFALHNPVMQNIQVTQIRAPTVLKEMLEYVIPGAQYDSSARDSPPRCHPGTRTRILEDVQARIHDPDLATRLVWIYGPAGVGKSAIMQTLAEAEASRGAIFTTLFFSRPNERDDPKKTFATLAYGLAVHNSEYRRYIGERLADDPMFLAKSMDEQFQHLFITPFLTPFPKNRVNFGSRRWVVLLDGLDECRGDGQQRRIVELIRNSMLHCAMSTPFVWIIASRPEAHLKTQVARIRTSVTGFWEVEVPINSSQSLRDVECYLHVQFVTMYENDPDSIPPLWPSESDLLKVSEASSGLFVFASTLIAYLVAGDPVSRLKHVISLIKATRAQTLDPQQNPFRMLDLLYTHIMSDVPKEILSITKLLLGFYLLSTSPALRFGLLPTSSSLGNIPLLCAANILELGQHEVYAALHKLYSVLDCPSPQEAATRPVKFLHASFSEFLLEPSRSGSYCIDLHEETIKTWQYCTKILHQYEVHRAFDHIKLSWVLHDIDLAYFQETVWQDARKTWMQVLLNYRKGTGQNTSHLTCHDASFVIETLQVLGPTIFRDTKEWTTLNEDFLRWLRQHAPPEIKSNFLRENFPLCDLDVDKLFKSLCTQRWGYFTPGETFWDRLHSSNFDLVCLEQFSASEWSKAKNTLWNQSSTLGNLLRKENQQMRSWVLGFGGARQCIVTELLFREHTAGIASYILPYSDEHSR